MLLEGLGRHHVLFPTFGTASLCDLRLCSSIDSRESNLSPQMSHRFSFFPRLLKNLSTSILNCADFKELRISCPLSLKLAFLQSCIFWFSCLCLRIPMCSFAGWSFDFRYYPLPFFSWICPRNPFLISLVTRCINGLRTDSGQIRPLSCQ